MSGGITQLVAIGAQDAHLVGSPEVSFFRSNYKRHTNFAHVVERQTIQGNPVANGLSTVRFERKGDLLSYVYLTCVNGSASNVITYDAISKVELLIGGQVIEEHDSTFLSGVSTPLLDSTERRTGNHGLFLPLKFSFCQNWQSALPLVSLQYHDVEIRITWASSIGSVRYECWADFIYLDTMEREQLSNEPQMMLIHQVQKAIQSGTKTQELNFNHPMKCLAATSNITGTPGTDTLRLQVNGVDVGEAKQETPHYSNVNFYYHVSHDLNNTDDRFLIPFCLDIQKLQPTGSLNFSRLDSARIVSSSNLDNEDIYGINYNILRIQNGMGGLMYAN